MKFNRLSDLIAARQLQGKRVFIRADLNVPQDDAGKITEDTRIRASVPAIRQALDAGAAVMVTSHLGRPTEGELKPQDTLAPVAAAPVRIAGPAGAAEAGLGRWRATSRRARSCCWKTAASTAARKRTTSSWRARWRRCATSTSTTPSAPRTAPKPPPTASRKFAPIACAGPLLAAELDALGKALHQPARPLLAIVAGSKVSTKLTILKSLADKVDHLIVGGGIANTFMLASA